MWGDVGLLYVALCASASGCLLIRDRTAAQTLKIEAHGDNGVRVRAVPENSTFRDDLVSALVDTARPPAPCSEATLGAVASQNFTSGNLRAELGADGRLRFWRVSDNFLLLAEQTARSLAAAATPGFLRLDLAFDAVPGERIYGLGQHKTGQLDNKGVEGLTLAPANTEILIPVAHSSLGFAFLFNLPSFGAVEYNSSGSFWRADAALQADFWVATTGDSPPHSTLGSPWAQLQLAYADATGHAPVLPAWTTGFWQCKNRYHNRTQLRDVVDGYVARERAVSLMIIDYYSWAPGPMGDEVLPEACWPDAKAMVAELQAEGVELMVSPYFHSLSNASRPYAAAAARDLLVLDARSGRPAEAREFHDARLYDLFQPAARAYAWEQAQRGYVDQYGLRHFWLDCDEPCGVDDTSALVFNNGASPRPRRPSSRARDRLPSQAPGRRRLSVRRTRTC